MNDYFLNEIDLDGFQVVKSQYFQKQAEPVLTLWATSIAFGQGAYQALNSCESIQLMINERRKCIIIRPSSSSMPDAIVWKKGKSEPKYCKMDCAQLGRKIFEMWNFDSRYHYKP